MEISTFVASVAIGLLLSQQSTRLIPKRIKARWDSLDDLPGVSRKSLYVMAALFLALYFLVAFLVVTWAAAREDSIKSSVRQCENRSGQTDRQQHKTRHANPAANNTAALNGIAAQEVANQASPDQGNHKPQAHTANLIFANLIDRKRHGRQNNVSRQRLSTHHATSNPTGSSITQVGAA